MSSRRPSKGGTGGKKASAGQSGKRGSENSKPRAASGKPPASTAKGAKEASTGKARGSAGSGAPSRRRSGRAGTARSGPREISAGGVVVRDGEVVVIVPTRRSADGSRVLSLPKGHVDPGETALQAAEREVREETGLVAEPVQELGESRYWYRRDGRTIGKSVHFYLFRYRRGKTEDHDDEVEEARWMPLRDAERKLSYPAEREMVTRAREHLEEGERKDR